jgi:diphthamide synthase (EF-2-diphthine--ammonia ligase)
MIDGGLRAKLVCVDPKKLSPAFVGRDFGESLVHDLPATVDPCGENGEFHTFVYAGPMFNREIPLVAGERVERDGFWFADFAPRSADLPI